MEIDIKKQLKKLGFSQSSNLINECTSRNRRDVKVGDLFIQLSPYSYNDYVGTVKHAHFEEKFTVKIHGYNCLLTIPKEGIEDNPCIFYLVKRKKSRV